MEIHFAWPWKVMENDFPKRMVTLLHGLALTYLADDLQPVTELPGQQCLRSLLTPALVMPTRLCTIGD